MVTVDELREMDCSVLKRLMNRDENGGGAGGSGSHGALGLLSGGKCLLLDCRPFLAHSAGYIRGSVNVRCNTIVRRRAKGSVSLEQILPAEEEVRARLRSGLYSAVIVYDERSPRAESLREDSTVSLVVQALRRNAERTDICLLKGKRGRRARAGGSSVRRSWAACVLVGRRGAWGDSWLRDPPARSFVRVGVRAGVQGFCAFVCKRELLNSSEMVRAQSPAIPDPSRRFCICLHPLTVWPCGRSDSAAFPPSTPGKCSQVPLRGRWGTG